MDIFLLPAFFGGLAFFLFGMNIMSESLRNLGGGRLEKELARITAAPLSALAFGTVVTAAAQSSSAVTVMLTGLADAGIIELENAAGVIAGANIGTTVTAWLTSTAGIESDNIFLNALKPENLAPLAAIAGIFPVMISKNTKWQNTGNALLGFAALMYGMELMKSCAAPLADLRQFKSLLTAFDNPMISVLAGALFTALVQSSSASAGILQSLSLSAPLSLKIAVPIIIGQNIGTCFTAFLATIGATRNAKRVALFHFFFNAAGGAVFLVLFYIADSLVAFSSRNASAVMIAVIHTLFNVVTALVFVPFFLKSRKYAQKQRANFVQ